MTSDHHHYLETNPAIMGGNTTIKGTRLTTHMIRARLDGGDTLKQLADEYRDVPLSAFVAAYQHATEHDV